MNLREAFKLIYTLYKTVNHNQEGFIKVWSINGALPECLRDEDGGEDITYRDETAETTLDFLVFDSGNKFSCDTSTCG